MIPRRECGNPQCTVFTPVTELGLGREYWVKTAAGSMDLVQFVLRGEE